MHSEPIGPDTLAALLDGTLPADQRERVLAELAKGGESYENLLEAVAMVGETSEDKKTGDAPPPLKQGNGHAHVLPLKQVTPRRWASRRAWVTALPIAAGIMAVMLVQRQMAGGGLSSIRAARGLSSEAPAITVALGGAWHEPVWSVTRGGPEALEPRVRAFRGGARFADLEVGVAASDTAAVASIVRGLSQLASGIDAGTLVVARLGQMGSQGVHVTEQDRNKAAKEFRQLFPVAAWFDIGAWAEAGRLAAASGNLGFFASNGRAMRDLNEILAVLDRLPADQQQDVRGALDRLRQLDGRSITSPDQLVTIKAALDSTVTEAGR